MAEQRGFRFIAVEGSDGAGKTSVRKHLFARLRAAGATPLALTRYGYLDIEHTRVLTEVKWRRREHDRDAVLRALVGDKLRTSERLVRPHLRHRHVLADRFVLSDLVDNHVLRGIPYETTHAAFLEAGVRLPDLTLYLHTPPEIAAARKAGRPADNENWWDALEVQRALHAAFESLCGPDSPVPVGRVLRVDNSGDQRATLSFIDEHVLPGLLPDTHLPDTHPPAPAHLGGTRHVPVRGPAR